MTLKGGGERAQVRPSRRSWKILFEVKYSALFLCVALAGCTTPLLSPRLRLAEDSIPLADIVVGADPAERVRFAAGELKEHLDKITGASFAVVAAPSPGRGAITISLAHGLEPQETRIAFSRGGVSLESGAFPEYAVYDFLRDYCGVTWLDPTDAGTLIPRDPGLSVRRRDSAGRPFAKGRTPTGDYSPELWEAGTPGWTNYLRVAYPSAFATNSSFAAALAEISNRKRLFLRRMKTGGEVVHACHSFYGWYDRFWDRSSPNFERYRPELFAKGYEGEKRPPQLCYTNPETLKQAVADIRDYFDKGLTTWGRDVCCIEPMDNKSFCRCERCEREYRPELANVSSQQSDHWFRFVNAVAREIAKSHPGRKISTLAYYTHCCAPSFRLEPNVVVHFCFTCNRIPYALRHDSEMRRLADWRAAYPDRPFGLWLYHTFPKERLAGRRPYNCFPGFFDRALEEEYRLFHRLDVSENIYNCGFVDDYENFLSLRWMWDPREPLRSLEREYFSSYGAAAAPLREFYGIVEERYCDRANYSPEFLAAHVRQTEEIAWGDLGTEEVMARLGALVDEAERLADTPTAKSRVANWKHGIWQYMLEGFRAYRAGLRK